MKSKKVLVALLSVLMAATFANTTVKADDGKDTVAKANTSTNLLTRGAQSNFAHFMQKLNGKETSTAALENFLVTVAEYETTPARFLKADAQAQATFKASVAQLNGQLAQAKGPEAASWRHQVTRTATTIAFLWNYQPANYVPELVQNEEIVQ